MQSTVESRGSKRVVRTNSALLLGCCRHLSITPFQNYKVICPLSHLTIEITVVNRIELPHRKQKSIPGAFLDIF